MSSGRLSRFSLSVSTEEDFLIGKILMTHDPDGSRLDSRPLFRVLKNIFHYAGPVSGKDSDPEILATSLSDVEAIGLQKTLGYTIYMISHQVFSNCFEEGDLHSKTMSLFDTLRNFKWDAKMILILAGFVMVYEEFQLIVQLQSHHALAKLLALLGRAPCDFKCFRSQFKALTVLVENMLDLTQVIIEFENLPLQQELLEPEILSNAKSKIYIASYWICRSALVCFSVMTDLRMTKHDQVNSSSTWTIFSLVHKLTGLCFELRKKLEICHQETETKLYKKLLDLFKQTHPDNQETLHKLVPFADDYPLKDRFSLHGITELKNKVVILLLSPADLLPIEQIFLLVQQTYDHPNQDKIDRSYVILWVPISTSHTWSRAEEISFQFLSNSLPFWSLHQPWFLRSAVVDFITQEWSYKGEAMLVVLDTNGMVTNSNAMDLIWIWGADAFPFSTSREKKLWEVETWTLQLVTSGVNPLLTKWVEEEMDICIYASDKLDWIKEFTSKIKEIKEETELQLKMIYVGWKNQDPSETLRNISDVIKKENLSACLTYTQQWFFWHRLECMKNSITREGGPHVGASDSILKEVMELVNVDSNNNGWVLIGKGSFPGLIKLQGREATECFNSFSRWAENVEELGLVDAIRSSFEPSAVSPCNHYEVLLPYKEGSAPGQVSCPVCKRQMEKFLLYKCESTQ